MGRGKQDNKRTGFSRRTLGDEEMPISPGAKKMIVASGEIIYDTLRQEASYLANGASFEDLDMLSEWLPSCYAQHYTPEFVLRFAAAVEGVAAKLADEEYYLAATIEELAAHAVLGNAKDTLEDMPDLANELGVIDPEKAGLDIEELQQTVFEDEDVLMLFDPRMDGIEDSPLGAELGMANLHVSEWFLPFRSEGQAEEYYTEPAPSL